MNAHVAGSGTAEMLIEFAVQNPPLAVDCCTKVVLGAVEKLLMKIQKDSEGFPQLLGLALVASVSVSLPLLYANSAA